MGRNARIGLLLSGRRRSRRLRLGGRRRHLDGLAQIGTCSGKDGDVTIENLGWEGWDDGTERTKRPCPQRAASQPSPPPRRPPPPTRWPRTFETNGKDGDGTIEHIRGRDGRG